MINVEGLTKQYGQVRAVDDLSFEVKPGIVTGFLGPNGAGKSTTMRLILGLDNPTAGHATIEGQPYRSLKNPLTKVEHCLMPKQHTQIEQQKTTSSGSPALMGCPPKESMKFSPSWD